MTRWMLSALVLPVALVAHTTSAHAQSYAPGWVGTPPSNVSPQYAPAPTYSAPTGYGYAPGGATLFDRAQPYAPPPSYVAPVQAYASPVAGAPSYGAARWHDPQWFVARVRQQMDAIQVSAQASVSHGVAPSWQLDALARQRADAEQVLARVSADGRIDPRERAWVRQIVDRMESIAVRGAAAGVYGRGGGPSPGRYAF